MKQFGSGINIHQKLAFQVIRSRAAACYVCEIRPRSQNAMKALMDSFYTDHSK